MKHYNNLKNLQISIINIWEGIGGRESDSGHFDSPYFISVSCFSLLITNVIMKITLNKLFQIQSNFLVNIIPYKLRRKWGSYLLSNGS